MVILPASSLANIESTTQTFIEMESITLNIRHGIIVVVSVLVAIFKQL